MTNNTLKLLEDAALQRQRQRDSSDPGQRALLEEYQTLWQTFTEEHRHNRRLRREVLRLLDLHDELEDVRSRFQFRVGLEMGLELGSLRASEDEP